METEMEEEEELPYFAMSFSGENCHGRILHITQPPSSPQVVPLVQSQLCLPQVPKAPSLDQVQGQPCEAAAGGDDWAGGGQAPGHSSVWGPAGVVGSAQCAQEDQTGENDGQHPDTR